MTNERKAELKSKAVFVRAMGRGLWDSKKTTVVSADYEVYEMPNGGVYEFLIVNYDGGAKSIRNCTGTSVSGIFKEMAKVVDHGYYEEAQFYNGIKANSTLVELN